jgi:hypothetical protein
VNPDRTPAPTRPAGWRSRFLLGLAAWLWVGGIIIALLLAQEIGLRTRALLFILGIVLLIRILGWTRDLFGPEEK